MLLPLPHVQSTRAPSPLSSKQFLLGSNGNAFRQFHRDSIALLKTKGSKIRAESSPRDNGTTKLAVPPKTVKPPTTTPELVRVKSSGKNTTKATVVVTVLIPLAHPLSLIHDLFGKSLHLELVSAKDQNEANVGGYVHLRRIEEDSDVQYRADFQVPADFGEIGAVLVQNEHNFGIYLKEISIVLDGYLPHRPVNINCESWVQPKTIAKEKRIFFTNKSYLPSTTPNGLQNLRNAELINLRGNGQDERQTTDRIYDYDVYNDLGNSDDDELKRPVLGGNQHPYPRRCRTGRPHYESDPPSEERLVTVDPFAAPYVPRDEQFSLIKQASFDTKAIWSKLHAVVPQWEAQFIDSDGFPYFTHIDALFNEGIKLKDADFWKSIFPELVHEIKETGDFIFKFKTPDPMQRDRFFWFRDEEFARQTLAGLNPCSIQLITEWPLKSSLDPNTFGPQESAITTELIESEMTGGMTVAEAMHQKKLFILDYGDVLLPFVEQVRQLEDRTLYGSRTVLFLNPDGTLRPLAIELIRPPMDGKPQWKQAFTPSCDSTQSWLWKLAKAHVLAHDSGYHQLISHWLRTHCSVEPFVIATNRQLSILHPIHRLLKPHLRYTMEINALARQSLVNAGGTIETSFSPGKYCMLLSSVIYDKQWRFDQQALPQDLISRGMAVEDESSPHGLKLSIEDYPFAKDGLDLWDATKQWVTDYVNHYYPDDDPSLVESDQELQAWWTEIRTVGHGDKKDETWWPVLKTPQDLIETITTIIWIASGLHAAVNFGQYEYSAYFPNRPTVTRKKMPTEDPSDDEWQLFFERTEAALLSTFPNQVQATSVITTVDMLSTHAPDEEYLGEYMEPAWGEDIQIKSAFEKFQGRLMELKGTIQLRNADTNLKNRHGAGILPYELLMPLADKPAGVSGKGVPCSISI